jgi:hypothetical protein
VPATRYFHSPEGKSFVFSRVFRFYSTDPCLRRCIFQFKGVCCLRQLRALPKKARHSVQRKWNFIQHPVVGASAITTVVAGSALSGLLAKSAIFSALPFFAGEREGERERERERERVPECTFIKKLCRRRWRAWSSRSSLPQGVKARKKVSSLSLSLSLFLMPFAAFAAAKTWLGINVPDVVDGVRDSSGGNGNNVEARLLKGSHLHKSGMPKRFLKWTKMLETV